LLREAAVNAAQQWKFAEGAAQERVATLKFSFVILPPSSKVRGQTQSRAKPAGHFQDFSDFAGCFGWDPWRANDALLRMTTRCNVMEQRSTLVS
jgi:hypothetical protein